MDKLKPFKLISTLRIFVSSVVESIEQTKIGSALINWTLLKSKYSQLIHNPVFGKCSGLIMSLVPLLFFVMACNPVPQTDGKKVADNKMPMDSNASLSPIEQYLKSGFKKEKLLRYGELHFQITDTMYLYSIGAVAYHFGTPYTSDDSEFDVIHDLKSGQFFNILSPGWTSIGMHPSFETTLMLLDDDSELEPVNYDYKGLEAFLNLCIARSGKIISKEVLDTLFRLKSPDLKRLKSAKILRMFSMMIK